jgi:hypothetical protein
MKIIFRLGYVHLLDATKPFRGDNSFLAYLMLLRSQYSQEYIKIILSCLYTQEGINIFFT